MHVGAPTAARLGRRVPLRLMLPLLHRGRRQPIPVLPAREHLLEAQGCQAAAAANASPTAAAARGDPNAAEPRGELGLRVATRLGPVELGAP